MKKFLKNKATMFAITAMGLLAGMSSGKASANEAPKAKYTIALEVINATKSATGDTVTMTLFGTNAGTLVRVGNSNIAYFKRPRTVSNDTTNLIKEYGVSEGISKYADMARENAVNLDEQQGLKNAFDKIVSKKANKRTGHVRFNKSVAYTF